MFPRRRPLQSLARQGSCGNGLTSSPLPADLPVHSSLPSNTVFLNVPFDPKYRGLLVALIAGLTVLGREPHCVLEVPSSGENRLERIHALIANCSASVHDLSRVGLWGPLKVPRFNMPFELGMAYTLSRHQPHRFFVFEERPLRIQASLSDLNGHDPHIHGGTREGVLRCLLDCFGTPGGVPSFATLLRLTNRLYRTMLQMQREQGTRGSLQPFMFRQLVQAATDLAEKEGLLQ